MGIMMDFILKKLRDIFRGKSTETNGNLIKSKYHKKLSKGVLKYRQDIICSWLFNEKNVGLYGGDQDIEYKEEVIDSRFQEWLRNKTEKEAYFKDIARKEVGRSYHEYYSVTPAENKKKIWTEIEKYWTPECDEEFVRVAKKRGTVRLSVNYCTLVLRRIIGKENYSKLLEEHMENYERKQVRGGVSNRLPEFIEERIRKHVPKEVITEFEGSKYCCYCKKKFYPIQSKYEFTPAGNLLFIDHYPEEMRWDEIEFCLSCQKSAFLGIYKTPKSKEEMIKELKMLADILDYLPSINYCRSIKFTRSLTKDEFNKIMPILIEILPYSVEGYGYVANPWIYSNCYKGMFGSWFNALVKSGILEEARRLGRGTMCLAEDEHQCLSLEEKRIDDWLYRNEIPHIKEPKYPYNEDLNPHERMRADWKVGEYYIEFFGLTGDPKYDFKTDLKKQLCKQEGVMLIEIYPKDINRLSSKFRVLKKLSNNN